MSSFPTPLPNEKSDPSLGDRLKAAGQLAARQAERAKLVNVTLPAAYRVLGRHVYATNALRNEFGELYAKLDRLTAATNSVTDAAAAQPVAQGVTGMAKAAASAAKRFAESKAIDLKMSQALGRLGKAVHIKHGEQSGPPEVTRNIAAANAQLTTIDESISRFSGAYAAIGATTSDLSTKAGAAVSRQARSATASGSRLFRSRPLFAFVAAAVIILFVSSVRIGLVSAILRPDLQKPIQADDKSAVGRASTVAEAGFREANVRSVAVSLPESLPTPNATSVRKVNTPASQPLGDYFTAGGQTLSFEGGKSDGEKNIEDILANDVPSGNRGYDEYRIDKLEKDVRNDMRACGTEADIYGKDHPQVQYKLGYSAGRSSALVRFKNNVVKFYTSRKP